MVAPIVLAPVASKAAIAVAGWLGINLGLATVVTVKEAVAEHRKEVQRDPNRLSIKERVTGRFQPEEGLEEEVTSLTARDLDTPSTKSGATRV